MATTATAPAPKPLAAVGVVDNDIAKRVLTVKLSDNEQGFVRLCWREAWRALKQAEDRGWGTTKSSLWASTPTADKAAFATVGENVFGGLLAFHFPAGEASGYTQLVSKPNLTAIVLLDRGSHRFLNVVFKNNR